MDIQKLYQLFLNSRKVSTDTRKIEPGCIFFALKGEKFDGNKFAAEALRKRAAYVVVDDKEVAKDERYILVKDVLTALQDLAKHHRKQLNIPVIGLTGSNGKTTTKELIREVLATKYKVFATQGNLNNHIGVPLSVLSITDDVDIAVIEMGANHVGEIAALSKISQPTHGFITNIGKAHIGTFGGFENIIRGKTELYQWLIENKGVVFINSQDPILSNMAWRFEAPVFYPAKQDYYHAEFMDANPFIRFIAENGELVHTQLIGAYNFSNVAVALCIGKYFEVDAAKAQMAVANYIPSNNRSQIIKRGSNTIIMDAYNANPSSMTAAIENIDKMQADSKVLILGDMFELEEEAEKEHRAIGELLAAKNFAQVLLCGELMRSAKAAYPAALQFDTKEALADYLNANKIENALVLLKASRGIGLETILQYL
ncbi:MAG TPA: UDP-N-acetylmuramoyl-tripeptide--D-alanyl-D-alanine ligase [Cyclobacteriaceae bacterium]|mgnify:CR=1 FL=1|nr:UDP-N-acetylmuramoyl-tripeptide--D-alanyl-D-alanine ligase [Cyclobacteriaceae bacterium]